MPRCSHGIQKQQSLCQAEEQLVRWARHGVLQLKKKIEQNADLPLYMVYMV